MHTESKVNIHYIDSEDIEKRRPRLLGRWTPSWCRAASAKRGTEGKIAAIRFARENKVPYLGICLGMQLAVVEFARGRRGMEAHHRHRVRARRQSPVIGLITEAGRTARARSRSVPRSPTSAAPCASVARSACWGRHFGARDLRPQRSWSATATAGR